MLLKMGDNQNFGKLLLKNTSVVYIARVGKNIFHIPWKLRNRINRRIDELILGTAWDSVIQNVEKMDTKNGS